MKRRVEELALVFVGAIGLGCVTLAACSGDDSTSGGTSSSGGTGGTSSGGAGGASTGGTGGTSTGGAGGATGGAAGATGGGGGTSTGGAGGTTGGAGATIGGAAGATGGGGGTTGGAGGTPTGGAGGTTGGAGGATGGAGGTTGGAGGTTGGAGGTGGTSMPDGGAADAPGTTTDGGVASCTSDPSTVSNTSAVVDAANALAAKLTSTQQTTIQLTTTVANARQWSNLPTTFVPRNGVALVDMSADAQTAAEALVAVAAGTTGTTLFSELRAADDYLVTNGGASSTDYGKGRYFVAFIGVPSTTAMWMLQIAGHHLAYNFTYNAKCTSATPLFDGVEPTSWTDATAHAPLETQRAALVALLAAVSPKTESKLTGTFSDLLMGPTGMMGDIKYPASLPYPTGTTGRGVAVATLAANERALVKTTIEAWVKNTADPISTALLAQYESEDALNQTYVGYSGAADLTTQSSYVRIDGPRVWIELTVQGGIVYKNKVHYHSIWRDKAADYGAEYR